MENNVNLALNQIEFDEGNRLWRMLTVRLNNVEANKRERETLTPGEGYIRTF